MRAHEVAERLLKKFLEGPAAAHAMIRENEEIIGAPVSELTADLVKFMDARINAAQGAQRFGRQHAMMVGAIIVAVVVRVDGRDAAIDV